MSKWNTPVYTKFDMSRTSKDQEEQLVAWTLFNFKKKELEKNNKMQAFQISFIDKDIEEISKNLRDISKKTGIDLINILNQLSERVNEGVLKEKLKENEKNIERVSKRLNLIEKSLEEKLLYIKDHSCILSYKNNGWKTPEEFSDLIEEKIKKRFGNDKNVTAYFDESNEETEITFKFSGYSKKEFEDFLLSTVRDLRDSYQNYVENDEYLSQSAEDYKSDKSKSFPFGLFGKNPNNKFNIYTSNESRQKNEEDFEIYVKSQWNAKKNGDLLDYQVMQPHFIIENHEDDVEVKNWYNAVFGTTVRGENISKDYEGYEKIANISQLMLLEDNPELTLKAQKELDKILSLGTKKENKIKR
jgi:hypothetical protein